MKRFLPCVLAMALTVLITVPALANFTPSVENKPAPEVVKPTPDVVNPDSDDDKPEPGVVPEPEVELKEDTVAIIKDSSSGALVEEVSRAELVITPASEKHSAPVQNITDNLVRAEVQITDADHLGQLTYEVEAALLQAKKENKIPHINDVKVEDLVVRDLFDVSIVRDNQIVAIPNGHTITFCIQTDLSDDVLHFVLRNTVNNEWEVLEEVQAMHNGIITITVDSLGPFAILVDGAANLDVDPSAPESPQTGESVSPVFAAGAVALLCAAAFLHNKGNKRAAD